MLNDVKNKDFQANNSLFFYKSSIINVPLYRMFPSKKISHKRKIVSFQNKNFKFFRSAKIYKKIFLLLLNFYFSSEHLRSLLDSKVHLFKFQELLDPLIYLIWIFKYRFFKKVKFYFFSLWNYPIFIQAFCLPLPSIARSIKDAILKIFLLFPAKTKL